MPKAAELRAPDPPDQGGVYFEVHTPGVYRDLFGTLQAFDPLDQQMPLALSLPAKVGSSGGQGLVCTPSSLSQVESGLSRVSVSVSVSLCTTPPPCPSLHLKIFTWGVGFQSLGTALL